MGTGAHSPEGQLLLKPTHLWAGGLEDPVVLHLPIVFGGVRNQDSLKSCVKAVNNSNENKQKTDKYCMCPVKNPEGLSPNCWPAVESFHLNPKGCGRARHQRRISERAGFYLESRSLLCIEGQTRRGFVKPWEGEHERQEQKVPAGFRVFVKHLCQVLRIKYRYGDHVFLQMWPCGIWGAGVLLLWGL